jgi:UDP-N-acetyl-D-mannosaminuronic acid dehydrogenase
MAKLYNPVDDETTGRQDIRRAFTSGEAPVAVYGLGKMGLPLAATFADVTGNVIGVDIDQAVVDSVNDGESHVVNEPGLPELVEKTVESGALRATTESAAAATEAVVHVIIVPTLLDSENSADLSTVRTVAGDIATGLEAGEMVLLESTVPPRTTRDVLLPKLAAESGVSEGEFGLAFCPERTASGRALRDIRESYPKVVGGIDEQSTAVAAGIYDAITSNEVLPVSDATTAEAVKIFEGLYRDVNIALANQVAVVGEELGIDSREAINIANTQPLCDILRPGPGVGGHCIPVYPHFVLDSVESPTDLIQAARETNDRMPEYTVAQTERLLGEQGQSISGARIGVFGLTYKANIDETRNAPALDIIELLAERNADIVAVDPLVAETATFDSATLLPLGEAVGQQFDAVVVVTDHDQFEDVEWNRLPGAPLVVDCREVVSPVDAESVVYKLGSGVQRQTSR